MTSVIDHVDEAQSTLGRRLLLENPATYVRFQQSTIPETEFLAAIARATGCGLLLDVNNVFVAARNHATSASAYLEAFPLDLVGEIHLAGHFETIDGQGSPLCIDAHGIARRRGRLCLVRQRDRPHRAASDADRMGQ